MARIDGAKCILVQWMAVDVSAALTAIVCWWHRNMVAENGHLWYNRPTSRSGLSTVTSFSKFSPFNQFFLAIAVRLVDHALATIFRQVDVDCLKNCELVSRGWREAVHQSGIWKKLVDYNVDILLLYLFSIFHSTNVSFLRLWTICRYLNTISGVPQPVESFLV